MTTITYKKLLLPALLPAIILASCNREELDGNDTGSRTPVAFTAVVQSAALPQFTDSGGSSPATRTALGSDGSTAWTQGDAVSVFMLTSGGTLPDGIIPGGDNVLHNVDPASGALTPAGGTPIYYPQNTAEVVDFIAWHNPTGHAPDGDYTLSLHAGDQTTAGKQLALDPLYSDNARGISRSHHPVALRFRHLMSKVRFDITLGLGLANGTLTDVQLQGMNEEGSFDLRDGSVRGVVTSGVPVAALKSAVASEGADATYTALIFPQEANSGNTTIAVTVNGKEYTGILPVTDAYEANTMYTYRVTVDGTGVEVGMPTTDVPWTEGELPVVTLGNKTFRLIRNAADLKRFADDVNGGQWDLNALQTADIDLSGIDNWVPIGHSNAATSGKAFTGIYNGNGYTISRLKINSVRPGSYMGLFGRTGSGALLTGIHLRDVEIIAKDEVANRAGTIAGYVDGGATVSLCSAQGVVNVSLPTWGYIGGLAGSNYGVITRCRTDVTVTVDATLIGQQVAYVGGITGFNAEGGLLFACHATGSVTLKGRHRDVVDANQLNAGGIAGYNGGIIASYANIYCCIAEGDVSVTSETEGVSVYAGGLAGLHLNGNIRNCYARGNVTVVSNGNTTRKEGAIVGWDSHNAHISYCYGAGPIGKGTSNLDADSDIVYNTSPGEAAIYRVITQGGLSGIPFTLYNAAATPAYGTTVTMSGSIQIADFWLSGDKTWPVLDFIRNAR